MNPNFKFNLTLIAENYYLDNNFELAKKILEKFKFKDEVYNWYKTKKIAQILSEQNNQEESLIFISGLASHKLYWNFPFESGEPLKE